MSGTNADRLRSAVVTTAGLLLGCILLFGFVCFCPVDPRSAEGIVHVLYSLGVGLAVGLLIGRLGGARAEAAGRGAALGVAVVGLLLYFGGLALFDLLRAVGVAAPALAMSSAWLARRRNAPKAP